MTASEQTTIVLLLILFLGVLIPDLFKKFKLPIITSIILMGAILGPTGLDYIQSNEIIEFFGFLGSAFLMLMAGLEVKMEHFRKMGRRIIFMAAINGIVPFIVGLGITLAFGYSLFTALLIGTVFISSSVVVVMSSLRSARMISKDIGKTIISVVVFEDMFSLLMLAFILQGVSPITNFPLPVYMIVLLASIFVMKTFLPKLALSFLEKRHSVKEEIELRFVLVVLMTALVYFSALGVHPIVAAFVVGLLLSDSIHSETMYSKLHTMGYGMFVPVFFFIVGMQLDLNVLFDFEHVNTIMLVIILGALGSKIASGYLAARLTGFNKKDSTLLGAATIPQLTTTLAVTYAASNLDIIDNVLTTSIISLAIITTVVAPLLLNSIASANRISWKSPKHKTN